MFASCDQPTSLALAIVATLLAAPMAAQHAETKPDKRSNQCGDESE
jgi:hypothetical protein